ncbi:MAG TPA: hypothetical protein DD379_22550 [Cyanobacteria bacterium UBA11162]|nr:hypothetical protein [Cyanobacteria bacterium UBA11162]
MVLDGFLQTTENTTIEKAEFIYITNKSVKYGDDVYQFRNVTGFGIGEVKPKKIPILIILLLFIAGLIIMGFGASWGLLPFLMGIAAIGFNIQQPKLYGLKLYLNSGESKIFITSDTIWLKKAVTNLYSFLEKAEEGNYLSIQVGGSIEGNLVTGDVGGNVFSRKVERKLKPNE